MLDKHRIGLYGSGGVPRSRRLMNRSVGPRSNGLRDLGDLPPIRRVRPTRLVTKTVAAAIAAPLVVLSVILAAMALANTLAPAYTMQDPAPLPYYLKGYTYDSVGRIGGANLNITNLRTGEYNNTVVSYNVVGTFLGYYKFNLNNVSGGLKPLPGDVIRIVATSGILTGQNETAVPAVLGSVMWENVTLATVIPEFGDLLVPIVGMMGMFAIVATVARSRNKAE